MPLTEEQRRTLVAHSSSLRERLAHGAKALSPPVDALAIAARLTRWRQVTTKGDPASFERLLESRHIAPQSVDRLLDTPQWQDGMAIPDWVDTIDAVIAAASVPPIPAEPHAGLLFAPFCTVARKRLAASLPERAFKLSANAVQALVDSLEHGLHFVCKSALDAALRLPQAEHLAEFLLEYSVAARAMATLVERWHRNTLELVQRLTVDARAIELHFLAGTPLGDVVQIDCGLSDPHNGGKSVLRLHFASGLRLVYKPRSVALDLAYNGLLDWLAQHGAPHPLRRPTYLARTGYAWIEHIDHSPCQSREELLQFCHATGALLCTSYLLDATDLHDGNVIAAGSSPVIVDLETLLQPRLAEPPSGTPQDALRRAAVLAERSILRTGLLPSLKLGADGQIADVGCLGSLFAPHSADWYSHDPAASPLSDAMRKDIASGALDPLVLANAIADGFAQTYLFLLAKRQELLAPSGPLQEFRCQPVRFLLRDTSVYIKLLAPSLSAVALREGVDRSIALESLYRLLLNWPASEALVGLVDEEVAALEALDIPLLSTTTDSTSVHASHGRAGPAVFAEPSYEAMLARLGSFSPQDLELQLELLHGSFAARAAGSPSRPPLQPSTGSPFTTPKAIAAELQRRAITGEDGSVTWMAPVPIPNTPNFRFDMLPLNKESGLAGVALFLAAYCRASGDVSAGALARQAVQTVTQRLGLDPDNPAVGRAPMPIAGLGSMVYALHRIGTLLDDTGIGAAAHQLVQRLPEPTGGGPTLPGSIADSAEVCLALLALGRRPLAQQWGQQLLEHWSRLDGVEKSAAAVSNLALCWSRLHQETQAEAFRDAYEETLLVLGTGHHAMNAQPRSPEPVGEYQTVAGMPVGSFFPSFDQGLCGFGYALLRHTSRTPLPCVQLWD